MSKHYLVGSGIASLAAAAYLIRDGGVSGEDIVIFEESKDFGGALDAHGEPGSGYFMSGSRMFEQRYNCTFELMASIPSRSDPGISVTEETNRAEAVAKWHNESRLVDRDGKITNFHALGFSERDRLDLIALMATPEKVLDSRRISSCFAEDFFKTNFWYEWCTLFAFQPWHSAIEFKRYLLRFIHHFSTIDTQEGVYRTLYNQYDSMAVPLVRWLRARGVQFRFDTVVRELGFAPGEARIAVDSITCVEAGAERRIAVGDDDFTYVTIGSMTADKAFGAMDRAPFLERTKRGGAWRLWESLARNRPEFGNPSAFDDHVDESVWESFTVTVDDPTFFGLVQNFTGTEAGKGGLLTFKDSNWLLTLSIFHQPFFPEQPANVFVWWGYGLHYDTPGNYVAKTMAECTGREILEEVLGHLHFTEQSAAIIAASNVIPCVMPYITSQFLVRTTTDRPCVVPRGSINLAFLGQFSELPDDVVFTVEYSIRSAQLAVYSLLKLDKPLTPIYRGARDPRVLLDALVTLHR